ncbi:MAG: flagellar motor protein MotB [Chloroflexota bacterium]
MAEDHQNGLSEQPIIIKKIKKGGHGGHHGGAWKVAYADFVTAMMAFFIVMWILASSEKVKESVAAYFKDPGAFSYITGKRTVPIDLNLQPERNKGAGKGQFTIKFDQEMADTLTAKMQAKAKQDSAIAAERVRTLGEELGKRFAQMMQEKPELKNILSSIKIEITNEGLRIELIESSESLFFEIGSAIVRKEAREVLAQLAREIGKLPNNVEVEGHTDSRAYSGKAVYSNWELSSDRANSSRRILESYGFWEGQIVKVTGFADRRLRNAANPFDVANRRVSILIKQLSSKDFLPKLEKAEALDGKRG